MSLKLTVKSLLPPVALEVFRRLNRRNMVHFVGSYKDWQTAEKKAYGYDAASILDKVIVATRKVISGEAKFERDSMTFDTVLYPFPIIAILLRAASENENNLAVLDFGGALGSSYFQCRDFLHGVKNLHWCVVEQPHFVEAGNQYFTSEALLFFSKVKDSQCIHRANVVLFSGVLQYLPEPLTVIKEVIEIGADYIVIDRNPFVAKGETVLSLQKVPKNIVHSSYPVWLFNESKFRQVFSGKYSEVLRMWEDI